MYKAIRAVIDESRNIRIIENVELPPSRRALLVILDEPESAGSFEDALLSEAALSLDWNRVEEDRAWESLK